MKKHKKYLLAMGTLLAGVGLTKQMEIAEAVVQRLVGTDLDTYMAQQQAQHPEMAIQDKNMRTTAASYNFINYDEATTEATTSPALLKEADALNENEPNSTATTETTSEATDSGATSEQPDKPTTSETAQTNEGNAVNEATSDSAEANPSPKEPAESVPAKDDSTNHKTPAPKADSKAPTEENQSAKTEQPVSVIDKKKSEENFQFSVQPNQTTAQFIEKIGSDAQAVAWENDLYASVMIAQAILETGSGNSQLAREPNYNLFGIKGDFKGKKVTFSTQEDRGDGTMFTISSDFRKYPSYRESLTDYAMLLRKGITGNPTFYAPVWKSNAANYQVATKWLTGRYATDTHYDQKLNALIKAYQLTKFDNQPQATAKSNQKQQAQSETKENKNKNLPKQTPSSVQATILTVQPQTKNEAYLFTLPVAAETTVNQIPGAADFYANAVLGNFYVEYEDQLNE